MESKAGSRRQKEMALKSQLAKEKAELHQEEPRGTKREYSLRVILREGVLGFIFFSLFHGLGPMIWFYPLNELEISGYEVFCLLWLSPIVTGIGSVFNLIQNRWILAGLRFLMLASVGSFQAPSTLSRLIILAVGNGIAMLVFVASFWNKSSYQRCITLWGLLIGFFALLASRIWLVSFNPTWWSNQTNSVVIAIGTIATIDKILSGGDSLDLDDLKPVKKQPYWLFTGIGFGSLMFLTHWVFGEVSIATRWVVSGYPDHGPLPNPWGATILISLAFGLLLCTSRATNPFWYLVGLAGVGGLYYLQTWKAYTFGNVLAVYTMSVWPEMIDRLTMCPCARTMVTAILIYLIQIFYSVWTVAYNFVPGGEYTREHTDFLMGDVMIGIGLGLFTCMKQESRTAFVHNMPNKTVKAVLLCILLVGLAGFGARYNPDRHKQPVKTVPREFSAAIWTYHFGYDNVGWPSLERSAQLLNDTGADVITLLESDASKPFLGNNDLGTWLGERLGMYVDFGPSTRDHTWGNLILSKYPIVKSHHHLLPSPHGELAPAVTATINFSGSLVDFVVTHMGNDRDVLDRELQAKFLSDELRNCENPAVFLGYVTSSPGSRDYKQLINHGNMKDIDATDQDRWCEYIMYKKLIRLGYARISHGGLSDTEVQVARFRIPEDIDNYKDHDKYTTEPENVEEKIRFSSRFGKYSVGHNWIQSHCFHMSTPKYFLPEKQN